VQRGFTPRHIKQIDEYIDVTATFSSAPPEVRFSEVARSSRSLKGGVSRIMASPNVTIRCGAVTSTSPYQARIDSTSGL